MFDDPPPDPTFKAALKNRFITAAMSPQPKRQFSLWSYPLLLPTALGLALLFVLGLPLTLDRAPESPVNQSADLSRLDQALAQLENQLQADSAFGQTLPPTEIEAGEVDQRLTAYIDQLSHIVALLEQLIIKLESTGHDAAPVQEQLTQAKQKLAEAQSQTAEPLQARDSLGNAVGHLRTSVTRAKEAL